VNASPRWLLAAALVLGSSHALAQSEAAEREARVRFQEGKQLYADGKIDEARLKFLQACAVLKDVVCERSLAVAEFFSGHYVDAYPRLEKILASGVLKSEPDVEREFQRMRDESYAKIGHLDVQAPPGAQIRVDDAIDAGNAPLKELIRVTAGKHVVSVQVETKIERQEVDCAAGKVVKVDFMQKFGFATGSPPPVAEGGEKKVMWPPPIGPIILAGVGAVGLGVGFGLGVASMSKGDEAKTLGPCNGPNDPACAPARSTRDSQAALAGASTAALVAGGVMIAGAVVWWVLAPRKVQERTAFITPTVSPSFVGASYALSF
jgi:hypothetical protein